MQAKSPRPLKPVAPGLAAPVLSWPAATAARRDKLDPPRVNSLRAGLRRLHGDQRGDIPVGNVLIIGLIAIPLVLGLIVFRVEIFTWLADQFVDVHDAAGKQKQKTF